MNDRVKSTWISVIAVIICLGVAWIVSTGHKHTVDAPSTPPALGAVTPDKPLLPPPPIPQKPGRDNGV